MLKLVKIVLCLSMLGSAIAKAADYPQWRGEARDGVARETNLADSWPGAGPAQLWVSDIIGTGYSSPVEVAGTTYITGMNDGKATLTALESSTGKKLWQVQFGPSWDQKQYGGERSTPTWNDGKLYLLNPHGQLYCLNASDGGQVWMVDTQKDYGARNINWGITESVVVDGDKVICTPGGETCGLAALDKNTGKEIWKSTGLGKSAYCSPVVVDYNGKRMLITLMESLLCGIDLADGKVLWQVEHKATYSINAVTPVFADGIVCIANGYKMGSKGFAVSPDCSSVKEIWSEKRLDSQHGGLSLFNGNVFGISQNGNIIVLDIKTGKQLATSPNFCGKGSLIVADSKLYCYGESSKVALVKYDSGKFSLGGTFSVKLGKEEHWAHPVVANGRLYIRHGNFLMTFDVAKR